MTDAGDARSFIRVMPVVAVAAAVAAGQLDEVGRQSSYNWQLLF